MNKLFYFFYSKTAKLPIQKMEDILGKFKMINKKCKKK